MKDTKIVSFERDSVIQCFNCLPTLVDFLVVIAHQQTSNISTSLKSSYTLTTLLTIGSNINVDIFLKTFIGPILHSLQQQLGGVGLGPPYVAQRALNGCQWHWLGQRVSSENFDEWHSLKLL